VPADSSPMSRRERNKQQKLDRITRAARDLFSEFSVDDVSTQQIADRADVGTGTLFLYAKNKGELLLMVQNAAYAAALDDGRAASASIDDPLEAIMALLQPVIDCNRAHFDNGRTYLREMLFGDPTEPYHAAALRLSEQTEQAAVEILTRAGIEATVSATLARVISGISYVTMAAAPYAKLGADRVAAIVRDQASAIFAPLRIGA